MKSVILFSVCTDLKKGIVVNPVDPRVVNPLNDDIQCFEYFELNGVSYLLTFEKTTAVANIYQIYDPSDGIFFKSIGRCDISFGVSMIAIIYLNNSPVCAAFDQQTGNINFLKISPDFSLNQVYSLIAGNGITTLKAFTYRGEQFLIAYNMSTGEVVKYQVSANTSADFSVSSVWTAKWATTWTRFSFFQIGAENFFIKTNLSRSKVNIDHFMDDANEGSHPVLNIDAPAQMLGLNNVNTFTDFMGFPYFATYRTNGEVTINRVYGNCLGWEVECMVSTDTNRSLMLPILVNNGNYILIY